MDEKFDQEDFLAAMYDDDSSSVQKTPEYTSGDLRKSRRMVMGAVSYDIPTVDYVSSLEIKINHQEKLIQEQNRKLKRLEVLVHNVQSILKKHAGVFGDISRDLDNKIDRRDF